MVDPGFELGLAPESVLLTTIYATSHKEGLDRRTEGRKEKRKEGMKGGRKEGLSYPIIFIHS